MSKGLKARRPAKKVIDLQKERLNQIQQKIKKGTYHIESDQLSDKLLKQYIDELRGWYDSDK